MSNGESNPNTVSPTGIDRDLENARVLIEDPPWCDSPQKYRKTAEAIVLRILTFDPENTFAKALLEKARMPLPEPPAPPPAPVPEPKAVVEPTAAPPPAAPKVQRAHEENLIFVAQAAKPKPPRRQEKRSGGRLLGVATMVIMASVVGFVFLGAKSKTDYAPKPVAAVAQPAPVPDPGLVSSELAAPVPQSAAADNPVPLDVKLTTSQTAAQPAAEPAALTVKAASPVVATIQTGTLAISSPTTVDIYIGDQLVGSAPTTLELPVGAQRLEYRHGDLRKVVTHVIKANEPTTAMITFDVPVQINARPWAQVFVDGTQRQALGQTPLSDVRVPIGSMLVFENPNFPSKTYRVTGRESEIRVKFP